MGRTVECKYVSQLEINFVVADYSSLQSCYCGNEYSFGQGGYVPDGQCNRKCSGKRFEGP
jgi:hypothetical protein